MEPSYACSSCTMELDLLDKKVRRLVCKLKKHNVDLEVFENDDIEYGAVLGKGGEGVVQQCTVWYNGLPVEAAAKTLLDNSDDCISMTLDELELLCLSKDSIVDTTIRVYGVAVVPDKHDSEYGQLVIITEAGLMNMLQLYQQEDIPLHVTYDLWSRVAAALHVMHTRKIIHQDLKPENILVTGLIRNLGGILERIDFKIIDLGMGKRVFTEKVQSDDILGTNGYHPPEVLFEQSYDFTADIFMLGVTFCVMLMSPNFLKKQLQGLLKKIHSAKKTKKMVGKQLYENFLQEPIEENVEIPSDIKNMLCKMMERQSKRRITLLNVVSICRELSQTLKQELEDTPDVPPCSNCQQDSGFSYASASTDPDQLSGDLLNQPGRRRANRKRRQIQDLATALSDIDISQQKSKVSTEVEETNLLPRKRTKRIHYHDFL